MIRKEITQRLDVIAGSIGAATGVIVIFLSYVWGMQQQDIGVAVLLASILYLVFRKRFLTSSEELSPRSSRRVLFLTNIIFLITFTTSILLLKLNLYYRPPAYFILVSIAAASIALEILYVSKENRSVWFILFKVIILSLSIRAGIFYEFPTLMGADTWFHSDFANFITSYGHVPSEELWDAGQYRNFPIFHILVASTKLVTAASLKDALFFSIGFTSVISTMFIYLIGKSIGGVKLGLFAMLIASLADMIIVRGITNITTGSLVLCWFMLILFLIFRQRFTSVAISLVIILLFIMILTHQLTVFATLVALIGLFIGKKLYEYFYKDEKKMQPAVGTLEPVAGGRRGLVKKNSSIVNISLNLVMVFTIAMLSYWMIVIRGESGVTFFDTMAMRIIRALSADVYFDPASSVYAGLAGSYTILSNALYHFGYLILVFLAAIGVLFWLSPKNVDKGKVGIILSILLLYVFTYGTPLTSMGQSVIPHRWLPFIYVLLTLVSAQAILVLVGSIRYNWGKLPLVSGVVILLTFFMLTTPYICGDSPLYNHNRASRPAFKYSEVQAASTVTQAYEGNIMIDRHYAKVFSHIVYDHNLSRESLKSDVDSSFKGMILLRRALLTEPTIASQSGTLGKGRSEVLGEEFFNRVDRIPGAKLVYNNGEVIVYLLD